MFFSNHSAHLAGRKKVLGSYDISTYIKGTTAYYLEGRLYVDSVPSYCLIFIYVRQAFICHDTR